MSKKEERLAKLRGAAFNAMEGNNHPSDGQIDDADVVQDPPTSRARYPDFNDGMCMTAVDRRTSCGPQPDLSNAMAMYLWGSIGCMSPLSVETYKIGAVVCDHSSLSLPSELLALTLGLKPKFGRELKRALEAALCGVLAKTTGPVDVAPVLYAIGTLIHTHPHFSDVVEEATWRLPYGEHTAYQMEWLGVEMPTDDAEVGTNPNNAEKPAPVDGGVL